MKITCESCQAKYTIADEKVVGKIVKIKCKKCGTTIVVNGNEPAHAQPSPLGGHEEEGETRVFGQDGGPGGADEWTVNVTDDDQRTMTATQVAAEYRAGVINNDTYVWKDGMPDWLPLSDVPELMSLAAGATHVMGSMPSPQAAPFAAKPLGGTMVMGDSPSPGPSPGGFGIRPAAAASPAASAAARRAGGRGAGVDLFGAAAAAEAPAPAAAPPPSDKAVGERNENSVLFSLSALTAAENAVKAQSKGDQAILDMRPSPGGLPPRNNGGRAGLDDIMNLGGGGFGGGQMLAPPPLLAPVIEPPPPPKPPPSAAPQPMGMSPMLIAAPPPKKSPAGLIVGIVIGLAVVGGAAAFFLKGSPPPPTTPDTANQQVSATPSAAETAAAANTAAPTDTAAPSGEPSAVAGAASTKPGTPPAGGANPGKTDTSPKPSAEAKTDTKPAETKPAETKPAETAAAAPAEGGKEFNRGAASSALGAAAGAARSCKKADGPTGSGKVKVTFAPSGNVTSASVQGAPFAGTSVGGCIASAFRSAKVPAFDGSPVSVTKSFNIN